MPWCPKCELEYVNGAKICPDCNCDLVSVLYKPETTDDIVSDAPSMEAQFELPPDAPSPEELAAMRMAMLQSLMKAAPKYECVEDTYLDNRSGAGVLILCGLAGLVFLLLNILGIIHMPMSGFSLILTYVVMGCLFFVFFASGIRSVIKAKALKPLVDVEKKNIEDAKDFLKKQMNTAQYKSLKEDGSETAYLQIFEMAVKDLEAHLTDPEEGFAAFICDKYLSDIIDED